MDNQKKNKLAALFFQILYILLAVGILVYYFVFADAVNIKNVSKAVIFLVLYLVFGIVNLAKRGRLGYKELAKQYEDITKDVFVGKRSAYNQYMKVLSLYNRDEYMKAVRVLEKLERKCDKAIDYARVYYMKAACYTELNMVVQAITAYEKQLQYDMNNSVAWSNLGLLYQDCNDLEKAYDSYRNAIRCNPMNHLAYNNIAMYYLDIRNWKEAEYHAMKALEIAPNMCEAMEKLAIVYKETGDYEESEKYRRLYAINGGNVQQLDAYLASI